MTEYQMTCLRNKKKMHTLLIPKETTSQQQQRKEAGKFATKHTED